MSGNTAVRGQVQERTLSRIGRKPIQVPEGVEVEINYGGVTVKGPRGTLTQNYHPEVNVKIDGGVVVVERFSERKFHHALHGLTRSLIANAIIGVTEGYTKTLELMGVGYRVQQAGNGIILLVGYSHPVEVHPPEGVTMDVEGNNRVHVRGIDKQKVGSLAA
ncbi:MAG: 50S ribosomal protein L6, partial [Chloroflexota bacterium]